MYQIGDVLRGKVTGDLYVVVNNVKHRESHVRLRKVWANLEYRGRRSFRVGTTDVRNMRHMQVTRIGRNYQEKAK